MRLINNNVENESSAKENNMKIIERIKSIIAWVLLVGFLVIVINLFRVIILEPGPVWAQDVCEQQYDICKRDFNYGRLIVGSNCYDWKDNPAQATLHCVVDGHWQQVWSNKQCCELKQKRRARRAEVVKTTYRQHWCASICYLRSLGQNIPRPSDCLDLYCPY